MITQKEFEKANKIVQEWKQAKQAEADKALTEDNKKYIGKYYKFLNGYGGNDKWWLYLKVIGVDETWLITEYYEKTYYGDITIRQQKHGVFSIGHQMDGGYIPITEKEFNENRKKIIAELKA